MPVTGVAEPPALLEPPCAAWRGRGGRGCRSPEQAAQIGFEDDVGELLGVGEPPQRVDGQLELLALGHRLLADLSGGNLDVLLADGRDHVHGARGSSAAILSASSQTRRL